MIIQSKIQLKVFIFVIILFLLNLTQAETTTVQNKINKIINNSQILRGKSQQLQDSDKKSNVHNQNISKLNKKAIKRRTKSSSTKSSSTIVKPTSTFLKDSISPSNEYRGSDKFGFCDGFGNRQFDNISSDIQDTKALGFLWGRPLGDVFAQETVEKNGVYDFSLPDKVVQAMQTAGIKIFGTLFPTGMPKIPNSINTSSFAKYVKAIVEHYKGQITYWQIGIEPFCSTPGDTCYKNFFELTKTAYYAAKSVDPSIKISPGGPAPIYDMNSQIDSMASSLFGYFFKNGGVNYMDFFNFHYLVGKEEPSISKYMDYWKQYVNDREIWLSETGSRDVGDRYIISSDENKEADWIKKHIAEAFQSGIAKIFWCRAEHSFTDMPQVAQALQNAARQHGGFPSGSVAKRQVVKQMFDGQSNKPQQNYQQFGTQSNQPFQQPVSGQQRQFNQTQGGILRQNNQPGGFQNNFQPFNNQQQGFQGGGYCGDNKCDAIEQQTGGCPQDCK